MSEPISKASSSFTDDIPFQALIENITDAVIFADVKGNVIYANHQARSICGVDKTDLFDSSVFSLFPQSQVLNITQQFELAVKQEPGKTTEIRFGIDHAWFKLTIFPVAAGVVGC